MVAGLGTALARALSSHNRLAIAVSGGVDSVTLAHAAHAVRADGTQVFHAISPAVPAEATARVRRHAEAEGWELHVIEAGEFADPDYLRNPVNRCYFCKSNLYDRIGAVAEGSIASGANTDDLGDYRPGLAAAAERRVVHPFVEAGMSKSDVRALARTFGLADVAELPAQPCLASRIETGLRVTAEDLAFVAEVERHLSSIAGPQDLRCRVVSDGVRIELDVDAAAQAGRLEQVRAAAAAACARAGRRLVAVAPYRRGSAFLRDG